MYLDYQLREPDRTDIQDLDPGEHVCCIYRNDREHALLLASFVDDGLRRGEKVGCTVQEDMVDPFYEALRSLGTEPQPKLSTGQLEIWKPEDFYLENGRFRLEDMLAKLWDSISRTEQEGYPRSRLAGGLTPDLARRIDTDELLEYEVASARPPADSWGSPPAPYG